MNVKSYGHDRAPSFTESDIAPIHLADLNGRHYYVFADEVTPPSGGKPVSDEERADVLAHGQLIRQVKEEARRRILEMAPTWKQQNALADLYLLGNRTDLTEDEQETLTNAHELLADIARLRERSDTIERSFVSGMAIDYLTDQAWEARHA